MLIERSLGTPVIFLMQDFLY